MNRREFVKGGAALLTSAAVAPTQVATPPPSKYPAGAVGVVQMTVVSNSDQVGGGYSVFLSGDAEHLERAVLDALYEAMGAV